MVNWQEPELAALAKQYDDETVLAALRIAQYIHRNGIEGIYFKQTSEAHLEQTLPMVTERKCTAELKKELRKADRRT